jgi:hypothetical protein
VVDTLPLLHLLRTKEKSWEAGNKRGNKGEIGGKTDIRESTRKDDREVVESKKEREREGKGGKSKERKRARESSVLRSCLPCVVSSAPLSIASLCPLTVPAVDSAHSPLSLR